MSNILSYGAEVECKHDYVRLEIEKFFGDDIEEVIERCVHCNKVLDAYSI